MTVSIDVVGVGPGGPDQVTVEAVEALRAADRFLLVTKRRETQELVEIREAILDRHVGGEWRQRTILVQDAERRRVEDAAEQQRAVADWRSERARRFAAALEQVADGARLAMLAWGDPSLYDSSLGVLEELAADANRGVEVSVIPGISSIQALAAGHRITLNRVGGAVQVTTGRRLEGGMPVEADDVVVMLDPACVFQQLDGEDLDLYWGAYLGTADQILVSGPLPEAGPEVIRVRAEAKARKGWMFDTYLLRRR